MIFWLVLKLEKFSYNILKDFGFSFRGVFEDYVCFRMVKYLSFHNSSFALRYIFLMQMTRPHTIRHTPCFYIYQFWLFK